MTPNHKILIVEDEAILAASMESELARRGYQTCGSVCSCEEALAKVKGEAPDLVIIDYCLGFENNGFKTAERIRLLRDVPIVFISGLSPADVADEIEGFKRSVFLPKPFTPVALIQAIEKSIAMDDS